MTQKIRFIDLFAGIGGFHLAFHSVGAECVFASEIDRHARQTYERNFKKISPDLFETGNFAGDITKVVPAEIPDFDILCAGFPCQPFSQAGHKKGFADERNLFFEIVEILKVKQPMAFFLENVRHLQNHDNGRTFRVVKETLENLGYSFNYKIVKASEHGLPQYRPRLFMVGFRCGESFKFPESEPLELNMSQILGGKCEKNIGFTLRVGGRGSGIHDRRNWDTYMVNGDIVRLSLDQCKKMMGFPENFEFPVPRTQAMKQLGNAIAVPAVQATAKKILEYLEINREYIVSVREHKKTVANG